jgi:Cys-tRNA(Pro)/Cys-tRNA(Cys) deacylase
MHPNVAFTLEQARKPYKVYRHTDFITPIRSPQDLATALGYDLRRMTKSIFLKSLNQDKYAMAVCSMDKKANFSSIADYLGCKRLKLASREDLQEKVGYPPGGVSPIGVQGIPIFLEQSLLDLETIVIGTGEIDIEVEISPSALKDLTEAIVLSL